MNLFYLKHHYLSVVRSKSFGGEVIAFLLIAFLSLSAVPILYDDLDVYAADLSGRVGDTGSTYQLFLLVCLFADMMIRILFRRPYPKLKYYLLWTTRTKAISWQYMVASLFGIVPFIFLIPQVTITVKANEWLGSEMTLALILIWFFNFYLGIFLEFASKTVRRAGLLVIAIILSLIFSRVVSPLWLMDGLLNPVAGASLLLIVLIATFYSIDRQLKERKVFDSGKSRSLLQMLPVVNFKNPLFQLEWALIVRNKRTRSNLLMGMISIGILPFLIDEDSPEILSLLIFLIATSFFIIQHGVYSLGWEGNYFDFLITNVRIRSFIENRYRFYVATCCIGFLLCLIPTIASGLNIALLVAMFLYNLGITIPLVLYRSLFNSTKITLTENSFMNYSGMMTGPIFFTSFLITLVPLIVFGIASSFSAENATYIVGAAGLAAMLLKPFFMKKIISSMSARKYHLSQAFKS